VPPEILLEELVPLALPVRRGIQSVFETPGEVAQQIETLTWILFGGAAVIFAAVMTLMVYAILASRSRRGWLAKERFVIAAGIIFPIVTLSALLVYALRAGAPAARGSEQPMRIEVIGEQWWWRVQYLDQHGAAEFETANEIHIPAGREVEFVLKSADVLHSFWVPGIAGKLDMIPGRVNRLRASAERPGIWRGQCAEFCGGPHARMALYLVAHDKAEFDRWRARERSPAKAQTAVTASHGGALFLAHGCGVCHTVRGTVANGTRGPDLSHVGSRLSIAAGTLPNNAGALAGWIASGQHIKPDNLMPAFNHLAGTDLHAIAGWLQGLE
jgi:cytochrome c oxidase subunit II